MSGIGEVNTAEVRFVSHLQTLMSNGMQSSTPLEPLAAIKNNKSLQPAVSPAQNMANTIAGMGGGNIINVRT